ncbi:hypothetical protein Taro_024425, partial [Colocasia esculenta]|nr:hypothetical protein [Colocasia esculenta]
MSMTYQWDRTPQMDKDMLQHMTAMHKGWRVMLKSKERMTQMTTPTLESDDVAPVSVKVAFIVVMGLNRPGHVRLRRLAIGTGVGRDLAPQAATTL